MLQVRTGEHLKVFIMALPVIQTIRTKSHTPKGTFLRLYRLRLCVPTRMTKIAIIIKHNGKCLLENLNGNDVMIVNKPRQHGRVYNVTSEAVQKHESRTVVKNGVFNKIPINNVMIVVVLTGYPTACSWLAGRHQSAHLLPLHFPRRNYLHATWFEYRVPYTRVRNFDVNIGKTDFWLSEETWGCKQFDILRHLECPKNHTGFPSIYIYRGHR